MRRRDFVGAGAALAGLAAVPAGVMAADDREPIGIGIIGTGARGQGIAGEFAGIDGVDVVACCDVLPFRLEEGLAIAGPGTRGYDDYRRVLDDPAVDAVVIATPFHLHATHFLAALDAGRHVYCEKTAVKGYAQIDTVREAVRRTDRIVQVGYQYRHSRLYEHVVGRIRDGEVGVVTRIECQWNRDTDWRRPVPSPELERAINWRLYREYSGGLAAELSSHQMDFCNWLLDAAPERVMGAGGIDYWKDGRDVRDNIHLLVTYANGVEASFTCLSNNAHGGYEIRVIGSAGTVILKFVEAWIAREGTAAKDFDDVDGVSGATILIDDVPASRIEFPHTEPTAQALIDFVGSIRTGAAPRSDIAGGLVGATMVQKSLDAMDRGTVERIA